jgi:hypothetical protein
VSASLRCSFSALILCHGIRLQRFLWFGAIALCSMVLATEHSDIASDPAFCRFDGA